MTDIVERLREATIDIETREPLFSGVFGHATVEELKEAADEILRLREEIEIWKSVFPDIAPEGVQPDRSLLEKEIERLRNALHIIANDYVELSHEKVLWQRNDHMMIARKALEKSYD